MMKEEEREVLLEDEVIILRNSGEIPEIALYSSLYYLEEDDEGPQITLQEEELNVLYEAALERARAIVLRDLDPDNRDKSIFRGPARSIVNWYRLQSFCRRINRACPGFDTTVAQAVVLFLQRDFSDVQGYGRCSSVNCSADKLKAFLQDIKADLHNLPSGWKMLCKE